MLTIPHRTAAETSDLQRRIEHAGSQIARNQASLLARLRAKIDAASTERRVPSRAGVREVDFGGRPGPDRSPRVAILSAEASESTSRDAQRLEAALREIGWSCTCCVPDSPDRCHAAARLKAVADVGADFVLVVNGAAASLRALLPQELPIVSWLFPSARVPRAIESTVGSVDLFVASSRAQQAQLVTAGVPDEQVHYVGITAGGGVTPPSSDVSPELDVAVIGDVPADRAEAAGVTLSTHARLWNECLKVAAESVAKAKAPAATEVLERAQSRSGVTLREPRVRGEFVRKIEDRVMPGAFARHLVQELSKQFKVSLLGANWEDETRWNARTPGDAQWAYSVRNARWVVLPFFSAAAVQLAVDALSAGVQVALRAGNSPLTECHPELSGVAKSIRTFRHAREAVEIVRSQGAGGHGLAAALQRISINAKLTQVWELVREKSDAGRYHRIERRVCDSTAS
jgi:hypothetical protein